MLNKESKDSTNKEEFSFIQEQIVKKPENKFKRLVLLLTKTIILAIIFGFTAAIVFYTSTPLIAKILGKEKEKPTIIIPSVFPEYVGSKGEDEEATQEPVTEPATEEVIDEEVPSYIEDYKSTYLNIAEVVETVNESIVVVTGVTSGFDWFNNPYESKDTATGILVSSNDEELLILTYKSKLSDVNNIRVTFIDNAVVDATLKNYSKALDLAIVSVKLSDIPNSTLDRIKIAVFGTSITLKVGVPIIAVGNPNGYNYSFENGFVSSIQNHFQITDANIKLFNTNIQDHPNGKGFIIDLEGKVIGIITSKFKNDLNENLNTVMAISEIRKIIDKLTTTEERAYLGVMGLDVTEEVSKQLNIPTGVYITKVETNSPAFEAGLQSGDIILRINDIPMLSMNDLMLKLSNSNPKDILKVTVMRTVQNANTELEISIILSELQADK